MSVEVVLRKRLDGPERLDGQGAESLDSTVLDFWQWAFGDILPNDIRGVFSEWLVAQVLGISHDTTRESWAAWDLQTPEGVTIEVKSCAYVQVWHGDEQRPSRICWGGLTGQIWDAETNLYSGERTYNADLYVFCVQAEKDPRKWNALDLDQWHFYLLTREQLTGLSVRSLSESRLQTLARPMTAAGFRAAGRTAIEEVARSRRGDLKAVEAGGQTMADKMTTTPIDAEARQPARRHPDEELRDFVAEDGRGEQ